MEDLAFVIFIVFIGFRPVLDLFSNVKVLGINLASLFSIIVIFIAFIWMMDICIRKGFNFLFKNLYLKYLFIFILFLLPSIVASNYISDTIEYLLKLIMLASTSFLFLKFAKNKKNRKTIFYSICFSYLITSLFGFFQLITQSGLWDRDVNQYRLYSTFTHPNQYGFYLVVILSLFLLFRKEGFFQHKFNFFTLLISDLVLLLFTYSRSAWIWAAFVMLGFFLEGSLQEKVVFVMLGFIVLIKMIPTIIERFSDISIVNNFEGSSMESRINIWNRMLSLTSSFNLFGKGLGTFVSYDMAYYSSVLPAHNEYVNVLFESGYLGLLGFVIYLISLIFYSIKFSGKNKKIYLMCVVGFAVIAFVSNIFSMLVSQIYFVMYLSYPLLFYYENKKNPIRIKLANKRMCQY